MKIFIALILVVIAFPSHAATTKKAKNGATGYTPAQMLNIIRNAEDDLATLKKEKDAAQADDQAAQASNEKNKSALVQAQKDKADALNQIKAVQGVVDGLNTKVDALTKDLRGYTIENLIVSVLIGGCAAGYCLLKLGLDEVGFIAAIASGLAAGFFIFFIHVWLAHL